MSDMDAPTQIALVLERASRGDPSAPDELLPLVYEELRRLAQWHMSREAGGGAGFTIEPTALVHEAYLRVAKVGPGAWQGQRHFFAASALAMRRILIERARRQAGPRGRRDARMLEHLADTGTANTPPPEDAMDWIALDAAVSALQQEDPGLAEVVHLRYFAGLSIDQTASALDVSPRTVDRQWRLARAWLLDWLRRNAPATLTDADPDPGASPPQTR